MKQSFDISFQLVVGHEGGFSSDRDDRGNWTSGKVGVGKLNGTKYGVSAMAYPGLDIKNLTLEKAKEIYRSDYWNRCRCDDLPFPLDYVVFDAAVNHGVSRAVRFLQHAVGATVDGIIGPQTVTRAKAALDQSKVITSFCVARALFYTDIGTFQKYKRGWFNRLFDVHASAISALTDLDETQDVITEVVPKAAVDHPATADEWTFWEDLSRRSQEAAERAKANAAA